MDGRVQEPIRNYLTEKYNVRYVDSIHSRIGISLQKHNSGLIAISGHHDCAGNPAADEIQRQQIRQAIKYLKDSYAHVEVTGLWIDSDWKLTRLAEPNAF
jgi:Putative carbonic anhydrase